MIMMVSEGYSPDRYIASYDTDEQPKGIKQSKRSIVIIRSIDRKTNFLSPS